MVVSSWQRRTVELYTCGTMLTAAEYDHDASLSCLRSLAYNGCSGENLFSGVESPTLSVLIDPCPLDHCSGRLA